MHIFHIYSININTFLLIWLLVTMKLKYLLIPTTYSIYMNYSFCLAEFWRWARSHNVGMSPDLIDVVWRLCLLSMSKDVEFMNNLPSVCLQNCMQQGSTKRFVIFKITNHKKLLVKSIFMPSIGNGFSSLAHKRRAKDRGRRTSLK